MSSKSSFLIIYRGDVFYPRVLEFLLRFTLWNEQCNKRTFAFFLFLQNHSLCLHFLLVVKLHAMTSFKQTISMSYFPYSFLLVDI